jgi:hypothetical protein
VSLFWNPDPQKSYSRAHLLAFGLEPTVFAGVLSTSVVDPEGRVVREIDAFAGLGVSFLGFMNVGVGYNLLAEPRSFFPFVGVHVNELVNVFERLGNARAARWDRFGKKEQRARKKRTLAPPPASP